MSVIAWDGNTIVADRQGTIAGTCITTTKLRRIASGEVLGWTGTHEMGLILSQWYESGADPAKWPAFQRDKDDWTRLVVATRDRVVVYEHQPVACLVEDVFMAWGSGMDFALGAMAMGASAIEAVRVAERFDQSCGCGETVFDLNPVAYPGIHFNE